MDAQLLLRLDNSMLEAQLALDLEHLRSRFYDLIHHRLSVKRADNALRGIELYSIRENLGINFLLLESLRMRHPGWSKGNLNQSQYNLSEEREAAIHQFIEDTTHARSAVDSFIVDPSSLLEGRLFFAYSFL
jgi:hypothetical protein